MSVFYEILPIALFFIAFKLYDIYVATIVGIIVTFLQLVITRVLQKSWDKKQLITFVVFCIFGGMTLYFHNPIFVKWKVTIAYWIFALIILGSQLLTQKPLMQRFMQNIVEGEIPKRVWKTVNLMWGIFFTLMGGLNLYIAYYYSDATWVNFKLYGLLAALFIFSIIQAFYLMRYMSSAGNE